MVTAAAGAQDNGGRIIYTGKLWQRNGHRTMSEVAEAHNDGGSVRGVGMMVAAAEVWDNGSRIRGTGMMADVTASPGSARAVTAAGDLSLSTWEIFLHEVHRRRDSLSYIR